MPQEYEIYHVGTEARQTHHKPMKQYIKPRKHSSAWPLWRWSPRHS